MTEASGRQLEACEGSRKETGRQLGNLMFWNNWMEKSRETREDSKQVCRKEVGAPQGGAWKGRGTMDIVNKDLVPRQLSMVAPVGCRSGIPQGSTAAALSHLGQVSYPLLDSCCLYLNATALV